MEFNSGKGSNGDSQGYIQESSALFATEDWFLYWKTSASLWRDKIHNHKNIKVYLPLNWGLHSEDGQKTDFGSDRPETDLKKLISICHSLGKEPILFIPLTPIPFMVNGGVPALLSRTPALNDDGTVQCYIDGNDKVYNFYSFFDPRIFSNYKNFLDDLAEFLTRHKINISVYGLEGGYWERSEGEKSFVSYLRDNSRAYRDGFLRYCKKSGMEDNDIARAHYNEEFRGLYQEMAGESLEKYWLGTVPFAFLGGAPNIFLNRLFERLDISDCLLDIEDSYTHRKMSSSILLDQSQYSQGKISFIKSAFDNVYLNLLIDEGVHDEVEDSVQFLPLSFFDIYEVGQRQGLWESCGILDFARQEYSRSYSVYSNLKKLENPDYYTTKLQFFTGRDISEKEFNSILRLFLNGLHIVLDTSALGDDLKRRLELFVLENNLETEEVRFLTDIKFAKLGQGRLLLFDRESLIEKNSIDCVGFWKKALALFKEDHLKIKSDKDIFYLWFSRRPFESELKFEEVRRVILFNPTSYKKQLEVIEHKKFKFLRYSDDFNSSAKSNFGKIEVELGPDGFICLDFGFFED